MFLLFFGLVSLGMGGFTTFFGAGKSRVIGLILLALGAVFLAILYVLVADDKIMGDTTTGAFLSVLAAVVGLGVAVGIVIIPMMLSSKETIDEIESLTQKAMEEEDKAVGEADKREEEKVSSFAPPEVAEKAEEPAEEEKEGSEGPAEEQSEEPETPEPEEEKQEEGEKEEKAEAETPETSEEQPATAAPAQDSEDDEEDIDPEICIYCGSTEDIQQAHIIAPSKGGKMPVPACPICNSSKGDKALMEWLRWVKENRPERWEEIVAHNKGKRSLVARKIHKIRDEPTKAEEVE